MTEQFERVAVVNHNGTKAWRKQYTAQGRHLRMAALRWLARVFGADALLAPQPLSPEEACATEQAMIQRLQQHDVLVPKILESGQTHVVLSDVGTIFSIECKQAQSSQERLALLEKGFDALDQLHTRGAYVSQAFARNMTILDGRIGFIDMEEDPLKVMPLEAAQARDILLFVHSTARYMKDAKEQYQALLKHRISNLPSPIKRQVAKVAAILKYILPFVRLLPGRAQMAAIAWRQLVSATKATQ
jgi:tRNA A-37 threonylcarbamoyl transferase component Bud32